MGKTTDSVLWWTMWWQCRTSGFHDQIIRQWFPQQTLVLHITWCSLIRNYAAFKKFHNTVPSSRNPLHISLLTGEHRSRVVSAHSERSRIRILPRWPDAAVLVVLLSPIKYTSSSAIGEEGRAMAASWHSGDLELRPDTSFKGNNVKQRRRRLGTSRVLRPHPHYRICSTPL